MKIHIYAKCSDLCSTFISEGSKIYLDVQGYPLDFISITGNGSDYIDIEVDNNTGKIINWVPITKEDIEDYLNA